MKREYDKCTRTLKTPQHPVYVTRPSLPPLEEFITYLKEIWESKILTNIGPFHRQFENELAGYLGVKYLSLFANGTLALVTALRFCRSGEKWLPHLLVLWLRHMLCTGIILNRSLQILNLTFLLLILKRLRQPLLPDNCNPACSCIWQSLQNNGNTKNCWRIWFKDYLWCSTCFWCKDQWQFSIKLWRSVNPELSCYKTFNTIEGGAIVCHDEK